MNLTLRDPRIKLLVLIALSSSAVIIRTTPGLIALLITTLVILLAGRVKPGVIWVKLRVILGLIVMLFLLQCLFNRSGEPVLLLRGFTVVTDLGLQTALTVCLRLVVIILSALIVLTGESRDYLLALTQCKIPYEIAFMVLAALRFLPMLREEASDILCAAQMRGMPLKKSSLKNQAAAYIKVVIPVVAGALRRAENLSIAMEARGFRSRPRRTSMRRLHSNIGDIFYLITFCAALAVVFVLAYFG